MWYIIYTVKQDLPGKVRFDDDSILWWGVGRDYVRFGSAPA